MYDLVIIGAGPAGLCCGIEAQKNELEYLILEKGVLVNSIYHFPTNMTFFSTSQLLEIGDVPFISHTDKPTRREALEYYRRVVDSHDLTIKFYEEVEDIKKPGAFFIVKSKNAIYHAKNVVISTGFFGTPQLLNVPGEDMLKVKHYYDEAHPYVGQEVLVIGAANSACDVALETWQKGAKVTMAVREETIYKGVKYWIRPNIENRIKEGSIKAYFNTRVVEIKEEEVVLTKDGHEFSIKNDFVLAMTGYKPNYAMLEKWLLQFSDDEERRPLHDPETLETTTEGLFVAGVVNAGMKTNKLFIENTRDHGKKIIDAILKKKALKEVTHSQ